MTTLSVIMITKNEEENISRALESVRFADQVVICDSFSTDRTIEIAESYNCLIMQIKFKGFGEAKQAALQLATGDWVLSLDADEELDATMQEQVKQAINCDDFNGYQLNRKSRFLGRWIKHSGWYPDWVLRLFRRNAGRFSDDRVHESIILSGRIGKLSGHLFHYTDPNISRYLAKLDRYTSLSAEMMAAANRRFRLIDLLVKPFAVFVKMYLIRHGFRDGIQGLLLALFSSFHVFCKYAKLWELQR